MTEPNNEGKQDKLRYDQKKAEEKRQKKLQESLDNLYSIQFKKREWIVIYNILVSITYKLGDARIVNPICDKIQAIAAFESESIETPKEGVITN